MADDLALPYLPNKRRGVPRGDGRRVLNGIAWFCVRTHAGAIRQNVTGRRPRSLQSLPSLAQSRRPGSAQPKDVITKAYEGNAPSLQGAQSRRTHRAGPTAKLDYPVGAGYTSMAPPLLRSQMIYPILLLPGRTLTLLAEKVPMPRCNTCLN